MADWVAANVHTLLGIKLLKPTTMKASSERLQKKSFGQMWAWQRVADLVPLLLTGRRDWNERHVTLRFIR